MKQDNNIAIEVLEAEITACEISRARKIVINENRKAAEMDKEITSLQHSIQTLSSTDKVICPELDCQENDDGVCVSEDEIDITYNCHNPRGENQ